MADIAAVFHWPLSELLAMDFEELIYWQDLAVARIPPPQCGLLQRAR